MRIAAADSRIFFFCHQNFAGGSLEGGGAVRERCCSSETHEDYAYHDRELPR